MSTRSLIAKKQKNGKYKYVYCHWDGYPEHHLPILTEHYNNESKVNKLINLGNISELKENTKDTISYHRWRNEPKNIKTSSFNLLVANFSTTMVEYIYIFEDNKWKYMYKDGKLCSQ